MSNDTIIMWSCIISLLILNTLVFLYNQAPIENSYDVPEVSMNKLNETLDESDIDSTSSGLKVTFNIIKFIFNIFILILGWYPNFSVIINLFIKLTTYIIIIPLAITVMRMIRGI